MLAAFVQAPLCVSFSRYAIYENWLLWAFTYYIEKYSSLRLLIAPYIIWMFNKIIDINIDNRNKIAVDKNYIDEATSSRYNTKVNLIDD